MTFVSTRAFQPKGTTVARSFEAATPQVRTAQCNPPLNANTIEARTIAHINYSSSRYPLIPLQNPILIIKAPILHPYSTAYSNVYKEPAEPFQGTLEGALKGSLTGALKGTPCSNPSATLCYKLRGPRTT